MQFDPLLVQLDWCFTSVNWTTNFPNTLLIPLAKTTSDHIPYVAQIGTSIPKACTFPKHAKEGFDREILSLLFFLSSLQTFFSAS